MAGANHEQVPGRDSLPLIAVEPDNADGWVVVVRSWSGSTLVRVAFASYAEADDAETDLRAELADAPAGDVGAVLARWAGRELDFEDWWA